MEKVARIKQRIVPLQSVFSKIKIQKMSTNIRSVGIRNVILFENLKFTCHQAFMSLESSMSLKKLIFVSLTEDDRSESLMAFSEDLTGQLWKEKGTQRCLCQKYYLIPEQPLDWP